MAAAEAFCEALEDARPAVERDHDIALRCRPDGLVSLGLGGPEIGVPRPQFVSHFARATPEGLHSVPHAGESAGPQSIWDALDSLGVERIGYGIAAAQDPALMQTLVDRGISLEVCPTSNVCTRSVPSLREHPLPALVEAGMVVTANSDDPPMFATTLNNEYVVAASPLDLDVTGVADLARTAARVSFLPADGKAALIAEIDAYAAAWPAG